MTEVGWAVMSKPFEAQGPAPKSRQGGGARRNSRSLAALGMTRDGGRLEFVAIQPSEERH
jgi:hypothetical protein